jgi:hypothetical protein
MRAPERLKMRSFILACIAVALIATAGAVVLGFFQESVTTAFSSEEVRL